MSFHPQTEPLTIEQATHLVKLTCTPFEIGVLNALFDAFFDTLTELQALDAFITPQTKSELETLACACSVAINEPVVRFKDEEYKVIVPKPPLTELYPPDHPFAPKIAPLPVVYDADCPYCLRGHQHTLQTHEAAIRRATDTLNDDDLSWLDRFLPSDV